MMRLMMMMMMRLMINVMIKTTIVETTHDDHDADLVHTITDSCCGLS